LFKKWVWFIELTKKEFQPKKGEIINFLESHPIQCEAEAVYYDAEGKAYKYNNIEQNYYALSVEIIEGKKTLRNDPDAIAQSKGSFVSPPISANQAFEEYLSALGLSLPEGAIYELASDDCLHWKAREDLSAERFLEEVLLNDEWALVDVEISDPLENAAGAASGFVGAGATVTGESIQTQTAIDREKLLQVCSENENYSKAFNQVTQLINSENPELIEIGIWALYIKCRNINNTPLSHELNFINLIVDIGLNGKKLSEISNLEEAYERSILQLKSLLANYQADTSKEKDAINKLETIISRAECFRVQLIESGFDKVNLFLAIIRGEKELISNHLIQEDFDVNQTLANGATILMMAAKNGHEDVIKTLLDQKRIDVNQANANGSTALCFAARYGNEKVVKLLLAEEGIDVNKADTNGVTPLYLAAQNGHEKVVELLLAKKEEIDFNKAATNGATPLYTAANNGNEKVVKLLLDELRIDVNKATIDGAIPLHVAAGLGHTEIVETLLSKGADISKAINDGRTPLDLAKDLLSDKPKREKIIQAITRYQKVEKNIADDFIFSFRRLAGETTKLTAMTGGSKLVKKTQKESYRHFISTYGIDLAENLSHLNWQDIGDFMEDKPIGIAAERLFRVKVNTSAIDQETINKNLEGLLLYSLAKDIEATLSATEIPDKNFIKSLTAHLSEYLQENKDEKIKSLPEEIKSVQEFLKNPDSRERSFSKEDSPQKNMEELMHIIFPINQAVGAGFGTVDDRAVVEDDGVGIFLNMSHRKNSTFSSSRQDGHDMAAEKSSDPSSVDIKKIEAAQLAENSVRRE
jgi:ankyrin repeat protein